MEMLWTSSKFIGAVRRVALRSKTPELVFVLAESLPSQFLSLARVAQKSGRKNSLRFA